MGSTHYIIHIFIFKVLSRNKSSLCAIQTLLRLGEPRKVLWLPSEVMEKIETLRLIFALYVGLSFMAIIVPSYWSSPFKLRRLDGNYTGKKALHS